MAETHLIEVRAGKAEPPSLELHPGIEIAPMSVGTGGAWSVTAAGVELVHLYIYFDGQTLFLQSAGTREPPMMDGKPIPAAWTGVDGRCDITFGKAQLVFRPAHEPAPVHEEYDDDAKTVAAPIEAFRALEAPAPAARPAPRPLPPVAAPARPFKPGAFSAPTDGESTRLQPLEDSEDSTRAAPLEPVAKVRPAAGAPWNRVPNVSPAAGLGHAVPPQTSSPGAPTGLLNVPPPSVRKPQAPETFGERLKREWAASPPLRKALFGVLPIGVVAALWLILGGGSAPSPPVKSPALGGSSAAATATSPTTPTPPSTTGAPPPSAAPWPQADPIPVPAPRSTSVAATTATSTTQGTAATAPVVGDAGADRRERQAADFVATHAYDQAIRLYEQLAAERPQNPAFHEAARILRAKLESGTP